MLTTVCFFSRNSKDIDDFINLLQDRFILQKENDAAVFVGINIGRSSSSIKRTQHGLISKIWRCGMLAGFFCLGKASANILLVDQYFTIQSSAASFINANLVVMCLVLCFPNASLNNLMQVWLPWYTMGIIVVSKNSFTNLVKDSITAILLDTPTDSASVESLVHIFFSYLRRTPSTNPTLLCSRCAPFHHCGPKTTHQHIPQLTR